MWSFAPRRGLRPTDRLLNWQSHRQAGRAALSNAAGLECEWAAYGPVTDASLNGQR